MIKQYDIFIVSLDPTIGSDIQKHLVVRCDSPDEWYVAPQGRHPVADD